MLMVMWDEEKAKRLGLKIRELRTEQKLSQESLAYQAGITKNALQLLEAGRSSGREGKVGPSNPKLATLVGISSVLDVPVAQILASAEL